MGQQATEGPSMLTTVTKYVHAKGLDFAPRPKSDKYALMPEDPTALSPRRLGKHYAALVSWYTYAAAELSKIEIDIADTTNKLTKLKAQLHFKLENKYPQKHRRDQAIHRNKKVTELEGHLTMAEAKRIAMAGVVDRYDRQSAALSREVTRRGNEYEKLGRT